ncbi:MAG: hypothetical protein IPK80_35035 [Nannocystis sp.]|nr:hypothetical protein [Nannocystis sp.]
MAVVLMSVKLRNTDTGEIQEVAIGGAWPEDPASKGSKGGKGGKGGKASEPEPEPDPEPERKAKSKDKPKTKAKAKAKTKPGRTYPSARALDLAVLAAVKDGAYTLSALRKVEKLDVDAVEILAALGRLVEGGELLQTGTGRKARYVPSNERYDVLGRVTIHSDRFTSTLTWDEEFIQLYPHVFLKPDDDVREELLGWGIREDEVTGVIETLQKHAIELGAVPPPDENEPEPPPPPPPPPPTAPPTPEVVRDPVKLQWQPREIKGRETLEATWGGGTFRITPRTGGLAGLFFEHSDGPIYDYGCGRSDALKKLATQLAESGLPTPAAYRAAGGDLSACPRPKRLRLGDSEITWRETVEGDAQICVAAVGDGEFRLMQSEGGSFVLAFARKDDTDFDQLGCGTREALEVRALDLIGQLKGDDDDAKKQTPPKKATPRQRKAKTMPKTPEAPAAAPTPTPTPTPAPAPEPEPEPAMDAAEEDLLDSLSGAIKQAMAGLQDEDDEE